MYDFKKKGVENIHMAAMRSQSQNDQEKQKEGEEIFLDINFFRDLGPLSRKLNLVTKNTKSKEGKETRKQQKKILNHLIDFDRT